ncbi:hypothetical protein VULLAG_LOCUS3232 [Vulpes lagopus]
MVLSPRKPLEIQLKEVISSFVSHLVSKEVENSYLHSSI